MTLLVPVLDEEDAIPDFLARCVPILETVARDQLAGGRYSILFVDDGSTDGTSGIVLEAARANPNVQLVRFSRNFGKEAAIAAGLRHADGDAVIPIDVDLQDPPELIPDMIRLWLDGAEMVNAVRAARHTDRFAKRTSARGFYALYNAVADVPITSDAGDFRLLDRIAVDALNALPERIRFTKGLYSWIGFKAVDLPFHRPERSHGTTKWRWRHLWTFALDGLFASTTKPLRIWSYVGILFGFFAFVYAAYVVVRTLIFGIDVPGYASLIVVILFLGGLNMLSLGILGEYVGRIAIEVRDRPLYVVRETHGLGEPPAGRAEKP